MIGKATAIAHGAATIVNAIASGKGAAFGVDLWTKAEVKLTNEPGIIEAEIVSDPKESTDLIKKTIINVFKKFGLERDFGAKVKTYSNIPAARGLKSSSAAANAVTLATIEATGRTLDDLEIISIGIDAAFEAKVTITGAFDDACASYFGGAVVTDNFNKKILKKFELPEDLVVLFHIPPLKAYTIDTDIKRVQTMKPLVDLAFEKVMENRFWEALTLNGLVYSATLNQNTMIAIDALAAGAVAAGLCGKGPSLTAITTKECVDKVKLSLKKYEGEVITAHFNYEKAKVL